MGETALSIGQNAILPPPRLSIRLSLWRPWGPSRRPIACMSSVSGGSPPPKPWGGGSFPAASKRPRRRYPWKTCSLWCGPGETLPCATFSGRRASRRERRACPTWPTTWRTWRPRTRRQSFPSRSWPGLPRAAHSPAACSAGAAMGINALTRPGTPQVELPSEPGQRGGAAERGLRVFGTGGLEWSLDSKTPPPTGETGTYRAVTPENVELPTVPIINLSMQDVAAQNGGVLPRAGNTMRRDAISRARKRLGLDQNSAVYIPASNVTRNGEEYVLKITRASLNKMLSPASGGQIKPESIVVLDNIERIANNGVWFNSQGDRKGRQQVQGFDHLMTTIYIDGMPYLVDMRVKLVQEAPGRGTDNVLYYFTPEEILTIEKVGTTPPTGERPVRSPRVQRGHLLLVPLYHSPAAASTSVEAKAAHRYSNRSHQPGCRCSAPQRYAARGAGRFPY